MISNRERMKRMLLAVVSGLMLGITSQAAEKPVKVFILAGQSNMVGHGKAEEGANPAFFTAPKGDVGHGKAEDGDKRIPREIPGGEGSLRYMVNHEPQKYGPNGTEPLVDANGNWLVDPNVKVYSYCDGSTKKGDLNIGYGANNATWIGPEYGFGWVVGRAIQGKVLLIKVSTGGTSLKVDWRPPSAVAQRGGVVGPRYTQMVQMVRLVLANLGEEFPDLKGLQYEIAGFGWHQGFNDAVSQGFGEEYEKNLADLIQDVRKEFDKPNLPFVIATTSMFPPKSPRNPVELAQMAVADPQKYPQFKGNVMTVDAQPFWRDEKISPSNFGYHWNHNGPTHYEIGHAMGESMVKLLKSKFAGKG
jgi:hypothetical protein